MKNRTDDELKLENKVRTAMGLPKVVLTASERVERFGDTTPHDPDGQDKFLASRLQAGLVMSIADTKRAKAYMKQCAEQGHHDDGLAEDTPHDGMRQRR